MTFDEFLDMDPEKQRQIMIADGFVCKFNDPKHEESDGCPSCDESEQLRWLAWHGVNVAERLLFLGRIQPNLLFHEGGMGGLYALGKVNRVGLNPERFRNRRG